MYNFDVAKPTSIADAVTALKQDEAQPLSGGQTLIPTLKQRLAAPSTLVSLSSIAEMQGICIDDDGQICIGGATTHNTVAAGVPSFPALADLASHIGDPAVRNRGTIGGSLANNDPSACYPAAALGTGATIVVNGTKDVAADDYFQGMFATALNEGDIVTEVKFPVPLKANYQKFVQPASRFALVGVFVAQYKDGVRVAITGASEDGVFRWTEAEAALSSNFSASAIDGLSLSGDGMISDLHGSGAYRAHLAAVMTKRAVEAAA